ncbi:hypothetical protein [Solimicrobium silvestre]|uniref:Peptidoglycan binding domain n=1 Tax=Solimicrobium silvestre TaxID=2099400 RepID=A0A2S9H0R5_9BURK|nr:hypothetical protein [Solimicrobium silvestre]PRC93456.1 hypothetical protein S2091_1843 [Solimicrobium silvestre]
MKRLFRYQRKITPLAFIQLFAGTLLVASNLCSAQVKIATVTSGATASQAASIDLDKKPTKPTATSTKKTVNITGYNQNIRQENFKGLSKTVVLTMQKQLESIYQSFPDWQRDYELKHEPLNDGIVGPITLSWLQRFAFSFKINSVGDYANEIVKNVDRIAQFGDRHRADLTILLSPEFEAWDSAEIDKLQTQDFQIRRQGSDKELIDLVNRFRGNRKTPPPASKPFVDESAYFNYSLNQNDLDLLGNKDQIVQILGPFKDKEFNSTEALRVAVKQAMGGREYFLNQIWPLIEKNAADFDGYLINDAALKKLKETSDFPAAVIDELRLQGTTYFKTKELFDAFLNEKFNDDTTTLSEGERQSIIEAAHVFDNVHLTEQSLSTIQNELKGNIQNTGAPAVVVRLLRQIKDVSYPEVSLFRSAAISKIEMGIGACKMNSSGSNPYVASLRIADEDFDLLEKELGALHAQTFNGKDTLEHLAELKKLRSQATQCDKATLQESHLWVEQIYQAYLALEIESIAKKRIPDEIATIHLKGGECGCALDEFSGVVYGFYPYWNNSKSTQTINFSVLNRVAYYGLSVDNVGDLQLGTTPLDVHDGLAEENQFLRIAHQYNSKVDWLIQKNDWNGDWKKYSRENKHAVFQALITNITQLLRTKLSDTASRLKPYTSLGISSRPTRGDGITLYFPNYPTDPDSALLFNDFYLTLRKELALDNIGVNILISQDVINDSGGNQQGAFNLTNMISLRKKTAQQDNSTDHTAVKEYLLILLDESSRNAKKQFRQDLDNVPGLNGIERVQFLRSIIPVLQFDNHNWQQLEDDIVYASDNFGGIGLWAPNFDNIAIPVTDLSQSCFHSQQIAVCLLKNYRPANLAERIPSGIERFTCVNRWGLQLTLTLFLFAAIVIVVLFIKYCEVQVFVKRYFLWILGCTLLPPISIFVLLLNYDPYLASLSKGNVPFIIAMGASAFIVIFGYLYLRSQRTVPQRQRAIPQRQGLGFPIITWIIENDERGFRWIIRNRGTGYAIIKRIEILLDGQAVADAKTALEAVLNSNKHLLWKSLPLIGKKMLPNEEVIGLAISDPASAIAFDKKLREHKLQVHITYCSANNDQWVSDGKEVSVVAAASY